MSNKMSDRESKALGTLIIIIAIVLIVIGVGLYKFFTYSNYAECLGDRTKTPGMSSQQIATQREYCRAYFK